MSVIISAKRAEQKPRDNKPAKNETPQKAENDRKKA